MIKESKESAADEMASEFLAENAEFFAQAFAVLNPVFNNPGPMSIISEETDMTVLVGVKEAESDGSMDVDCILLDPEPKSLSKCIKSLKN